MRLFVILIKQQDSPVPKNRPQRPIFCFGLFTWGMKNANGLRSR